MRPFNSCWWLFQDTIKSKFTKEYNQLQDVRKNRFRSIDEKIQEKIFSSMDIFERSEETISRYNLALLCLPLVTSNGKSSRVNRVKGNDLEFLCGFNYKDASLYRYLRELKYLKVSEQLITEIARFWINYWKNESDDETYFVCYYIDGNTKPLWSSNSCYKGKVTMLGRVMNCLENVFIHDGKGHPLYFQTFQGYADLGKLKLVQMVRLNKSRMNYLEKFQKMIDEYNSSSYNVETFFARLVEFAQELNAEEKRGIAEKLTEEELAIFDLLTKPEMTLKKEKLVLDWRKRQQSRAAVRLSIEEILDRGRLFIRLLFEPFKKKLTTNSRT